MSLCRGVNRAAIKTFINIDSHYILGNKVLFDVTVSVFFLTSSITRRHFVFLYFRLSTVTENNHSAGISLDGGNNSAAAGQRLLFIGMVFICLTLVFCWYFR